MGDLQNARTPRLWRECLAEWQQAPGETLREAYGENDALLLQRLDDLRAVVDRFAQEFGADRDCFILRVPARINLRGMHIDHRGGTVNYLTIGRELLWVVAPRDDGRIHLVNREREVYPDREIDLDAHRPRGEEPWMDFVNAARLQPGDWVHYVEAAVYRLIHEAPGRSWRGFDAAVGGDIPPGAGLSSSSSLVVGAALAFCAIHSLAPDRLELARLCGEAEWYVGTRGGAGDHTAMLNSRRNHILRTSFHPIQVENRAIPDGMAVLLCHSGIEARKAAGARDIYNSRICAADVGLVLLRRLNPILARGNNHLRDVTAENLRLSTAALREMLAILPERLTREEALQLLAEEAAAMEPMFRSHEEPEEGYRVQGVVLYVLAECERGRLFAGYLEAADPKTAGILMNVGHNGDRVARTNKAGVMLPEPRPSGKELLSRWARLEKKRVRYPLASIPGDYRCSHPQVDRLVDVCLAAEGVYGASLTGAGLGGYVVALVDARRVEGILEHLDRHFYRPMGMENRAEECRFVDRAGML